MEEYFNLVGDKEDIRSERFKCRRASTFSYNRNAIDRAVAYASAIRTHLLVHGTAHPMSAVSVRPRLAADYLIDSAVDISYPHSQENPRAGSSAASGPVRSDISNGSVCSDISNGLASAVGEGDNPLLFPNMTTGAVPSSVDSAAVVWLWYLPADTKSSIVSQRVFGSLVSHHLVGLVVYPLALMIQTSRPMYTHQ